jgi:PEGA domain-containing protein
MKPSAGYRIAVVLLALTTAVYASEGNSWNKVRYNGGTLQTKVDPKDWNNHLTVTSDSITLKLKDGQQVEIPAKSVTGLSYGQEAHRRVGTMIALGILVSPVALFGLMHKTRLHFIGIEYSTADGKKAGLLLQGDKDNYRAILTALEGSTGAPLSVSEKDREYVPGMPNVKSVREDSSKPAKSGAQSGSEDKAGSQANAGSEAQSGSEAKAGAEDAQVKTVAASETTTSATVMVKSNPDNAEVSVDGNFMGNTPASLKLAAGKHTVKVSLAGYKEWSREITVSAGSEMNLSPALEKQ